MNISLHAIGRMSAGPEADLLETYRKRLPWSFTVHEYEIKRPHSNTHTRMEQEAEKLLSAIPNGAAIIALDERGKTLPSRTFSDTLHGFQADNIRSIAFIIGGADGLAPAVRDKADMLIAFGAMTWPHMLVRAMLAEQLYRAWSIGAGHPYHRD